MREGARSLNFKYMAAGLAATIVFEGERGRKAWSEVRANLAEVATAADDDPRTAGQALLKFVKDESTPTAFKMVLKEIVPNLEEIASTANPGVLKGLVCRVADEFKMTPIADSEPIHMVDPDMNFCKENMDRIIRRSAELSAPNAPYAVISIVGVQGIGKSFLLNKLFGTKFPELDVRLGRSRTTRGIMMSRCIGPSLLLLDFEGFDGTEQDSFFKKEAVNFALIVSDIMMVKISMHDIGQEHGASINLFRLIFQERRKVHSARFTKIVVILRFYDGKIPLEILRSDVIKSVEKIWRNVNDESVKFKDYVEVNIVRLPDKNSPDFPKEVTTLRKVFSSNNRSPNVPASSFSLNSRNFWDTIKRNKGLDIHQVLDMKY
uniref:Uncharacterized protein n=1 Tax=Avena sativa TaxID=4498 RepID=A0ACD5TRE0_AVESA